MFLKVLTLLKLIDYCVLFFFQTQYTMRTFAPRDLELQHMLERLQQTLHTEPSYAPWEKYIEEGQLQLEAQEQDYSRPDRVKDRLYMGIGEGQVGQALHGHWGGTGRRNFLL